MKHLKAVNRKAARVERAPTEQRRRRAAARPACAQLPHIPIGCSLVFSPGWEADRTGGTAGLCQPVERDLFDCHIGCYWPAQVPDQLNHAPDWTSKCAAAQKDWRKIDLDLPVSERRMHATRRLHRSLLVAARARAGRGAARRSQPADKPRVSAGNGTLIIGTYPKQFWIIDEATEKVVGTIPFQSGIPRRTTLSRDRKRFYTIEAAMEKVEIIDIAARKTIDTFTLSEGNKKVRIRSIEPDPLHRFVMMVTASATKLIDRFEIGAPTLVQYDLTTHKVVRTDPVAERRGARRTPTSCSRPTAS